MTTALLIYWRMWWCGPLPRPHPFVDFLCGDSANCHILGCGNTGVGPMTPKFELRWDFCTMYLTAKFHYHPTFKCSEVIVLTNKQTNWQTNKQMPLETSTSLRYATPVGNNQKQQIQKITINWTTECSFMQTAHHYVAVQFLTCWNCVETLF